MRRPALITAVIAASLLLAACGDDSDPGAAETPLTSETSPSAEETAPAVPEPTAEDIAALAAVTVQGELGVEPTLEFDMPFQVTAPVARVATEGTGDVLVEGQTIDINFIMVSGDDGTTQNSTWADERTQSIIVGDPQMIPALNAALADQRVGARILAALPGMAATADAAGAPAQLLLLEVLAARDVPTRAEGEPVDPPAGLPEVELAENGEPSITVPDDAEEPTELVAQTLIEGAGPAVESGQQVTVQYSGWLWDGTAFDSSWPRETPFSTAIGAGQVIPGWDQGLVGKTVGSQVLLVIPSDLGYGPEGSGSIPPDSTLIFVVDILDAR